VAVANTAARAAAEEAATGAWVREVEGGRLSRVVAPGMPHGVFGPWSQDAGTNLALSGVYS